MRENQEVLARPVQRLDGLTGLRWWAAFLVFLFHMRVFAPLPGPISKIFDQGYLGVTFFFVLSGFVLTWSLRPDVPLSTFYWRRFARVWPAHAVAMLLALPVFYTLGNIQEGSFLKPVDIGILLVSFVLLQGWSSNPAVLFSGNPAAWTLSVEALFYAIHPWVAKVLIPLARGGVMIFIAVVLAWSFGYRTAVVLAPESWIASVPMPITRVPEFLLGMGLAWAIRLGWRPRVHPLLGISAIGVVVLGIVVATVKPGIWLIAAYGNELFTVAVGLMLIALAVHALSGKRSLFESRWQVKLGEWSFSFYLVHATMIYVALRIFGYQEARWGNLVWFAALFIVDLCLAWVLYHLVESPVERRLRHWKDKRRAKQRPAC